MELDLLTAANRFLLQYTPQLTQDRLYRGYQNRTVTLAADDGEDYCVYAISDTRRVGTNITSYAAAAAGQIRTASMREYTVEVDFAHTDEDTARRRAETIETLARSPVAVDYFKAQGYGLLYADDIRPLPYVLGTEQYVYRYRVALHITGWFVVDAPQEFFDKVDIGDANPVSGSEEEESYFENVDVHHPAKE